MAQVQGGRLRAVQYVGRLAPSPTGALHLGNVRTFMIAWLRARSMGGRIILRMEDLDHPRDKPGAADAAIEDLRWLGFDWDEEYVQSRRKDIYREALECLRKKNLVYPCVCSRRDVESAQSAPHEGEQLRYAGFCRGRFDSWRKARESKGADPVWRFMVPEGSLVEFDDVFLGPVRQDVFSVLGDFPLARDEYGAGYTLACVLDDMLMGVSEVVRGDDLAPATPAQIMVARELASFAGGGMPRYCHVPLVVGRDGKRLAKRHGDTRISFFRQSGLTAKEIIGRLAFSCGWAEEGENVALADLVPRFDLSVVSHDAFMV